MRVYYNIYVPIYFYMCILYECACERHQNFCLRVDHIYIYLFYIYICIVICTWHNIERYIRRRYLGFKTEGVTAYNRIFERLRPRVCLYYSYYILKAAETARESPRARELESAKNSTRCNWVLYVYIYI